MVNWDFPCEYCKHWAYRHFVGIVEPHTVGICFDCVTVKELDNWHDFKPDNLSYIEQLAEEKGLI